MSVQANKALVARFIDLVSRSEVDAAFALLGPDFVWQTFGDLPFSGRNGKSEVRKLFDGLREAFPVAPQWIVDSIIGEGDRVAVECHSVGDTRNGFKYRNYYHAAVTIRDGFIVEFREYMDTQHAERLVRSFAQHAPPS